MAPCIDEMGKWRRSTHPAPTLGMVAAAGGTDGFPWRVLYLRLPQLLLREPVWAWRRPRSASPPALQLASPGIAAPHVPHSLLLYETAKWRHPGARRGEAHLAPEAGSSLPEEATDIGSLPCLFFHPEFRMEGKSLKRRFGKSSHGNDTVALHHDGQIKLVLRSIVLE